MGICRINLHKFTLKLCLNSYIQRLYLWVFPSKGYGLWNIRKLWVFPANQLGKVKNVWIIKEYGLSELWVKRDSTVHVAIVYVTCNLKEGTPYFYMIMMPVV